MDFFKVRKFGKAHKPEPERDYQDKPIPSSVEPNYDVDKPVAPDTSADVDDDDDDDDFITNEVKRRLKELRRNSFMMLIPEESGAEEDDDDGETSSSEGRDFGMQVQHVYCDFDSIYEKYCERMLCFDRISSQQLNEAAYHLPSQSALHAPAGSRNHSAPPTPSPRSVSRKLASPFRCLSLKKLEELNDETEQLRQPEYNPYQDLETAYVGHICLSWEALHCQYTQLSQKISCQPESTACYNYSAQQYQQFQVLLQRFIENEPFEQGSRPEIYAKTRQSLPKLLQVPNVRGSYQNAADEASDRVVLAPGLMKLLESSILAFHVFSKTDKKKPGGLLNLFGSQNQMATPLQQVQSAAQKKELKLKELRKKKKGWKKKTWPATHEEVELLLSLIDIKVVSRVLRMVKITKEQLLWCEDKMKKLDLTDGKLQRDPSPILFPC